MEEERKQKTIVSSNIYCNTTSFELIHRSFSSTTIN